MKADDTQYKRLAQAYAEAYGEKLLKERGALPPLALDEARALRSLDERVQSEIKRYKLLRRKRVMGAVSGIAAAVVMLLLATPLARELAPPTAQAPAAAPAAPAPAAPAPAPAAPAPAAPTPAAPAAPAPAAPAPAPAAPAAPAPAPAAPAPAAPAAPAPEPAAPAPAEAAPEPAAPVEQQYEIIPLAFELPQNFTIDAVLQDRGKTVYRLGDAREDDVVLTLEYAEAPETDGLNEIEINASKAYGKYGADYSVLTFEKDGVVFNMTCKYDLNTLIGLGKDILV